MTVMVDWGDADDIILLWKFSAEWTWSDIRSALNQSKQLVSGTSQDVVLMVDLRYVKSHPNGMLHYFPDVYKNLPEEISHVIVIDDKAVFHSLFQMLNFQHPNLMEKFCLVDNVDDAYNAVNEVVAYAI